MNYYAPTIKGVSNREEAEKLYGFTDKPDHNRPVQYWFDINPIDSIPLDQQEFLSDFTPCTYLGIHPSTRLKLHLAFPELSPEQSEFYKNYAINEIPWLVKFSVPYLWARKPNLPYGTANADPDSWLKIPQTMVPVRKPTPQEAWVYAFGGIVTLVNIKDFRRNAPPTTEDSEVLSLLKKIALKLGVT